MVGLLDLVPADWDYRQMESEADEADPPVPSTSIAGEGTFCSRINSKRIRDSGSTYIDKSSRTA